MRRQQPDEREHKNGDKKGDEAGKEAGEFKEHSVSGLAERVVNLLPHGVFSLRRYRCYRTF